MKQLLPIGSVVLLKNSTKKIMIIGYCQKEVGNQEKIWDYAACVFPEGYLAADKTFLFDSEQIETVYFLGLQDQEQMKFVQYAEQVLQEKKNKLEEK